MNPETQYIQRQGAPLKFFAYEEIGLGEKDVTALAARLRGDEACRQYRDIQGKPYAPPADRGYTVVPILPMLWGMPLCDAVLAFVHGFHPSKIRISTGTVTTDCCTGRVTIRVEEREGREYVTRIDQEIEIGYGSGYEVGYLTRSIRENQPLPATISQGPFINEDAVCKAGFS